MTKEEAKKKIEDTLTKMVCTDVSFEDSADDLIVVTFNCKAVTSFVADIHGWTYSGIHLDPTGKRQYRIDFKKGQ